MNLADLKGAVLLLGLIALVAASAAIALDAFGDEVQEDNAGAGCNATHKGACGFAYNITQDGLGGVDNSTDFLDTIGTIMGVAVLISLVMLAFAFGRR